MKTYILFLNTIRKLQYLKSKLPLNNPLLQAILPIDPAAHGCITTSNYLSQLPELVTSVFYQKQKLMAIIKKYIIIIKSMKTYQTHSIRIMCLFE